MRRMIEAVKRELQEAIASMGLRVKFELLHDEVPQVNTIKAYIQQTEQAMVHAQDRLGAQEHRDEPPWGWRKRKAGGCVTPFCQDRARGSGGALQERRNREVANEDLRSTMHAHTVVAGQQAHISCRGAAAYLEEAVHRETERGSSMEGEWKTTKATLDALILDGDFDVVRVPGAGCSCAVASSQSTRLIAPAPIHATHTLCLSWLPGLPPIASRPAHRHRRAAALLCRR
jgi:hypothetical protein